METCNLIYSYPTTYMLSLDTHKKSICIFNCPKTIFHLLSIYIADRSTLANISIVDIFPDLD